jgi:hypothetical protein
VCVCGAVVVALALAGCESEARIMVIFLGWAILVPVAVDWTNPRFVRLEYGSGFG